jgi:hypothetical protein
MALPALARHAMALARHGTGMAPAWHWPCMALARHGTGTGMLLHGIARHATAWHGPRAEGALRRCVLRRSAALTARARWSEARSRRRRRSRARRSSTRLDRAAACPRESIVRAGSACACSGAGRGRMRERAQGRGHGRECWNSVCSWPRCAASPSTTPTCSSVSPLSTGTSTRAIGPSAARPGAARTGRRRRRPWPHGAPSAHALRYAQAGESAQPGGGGGGMLALGQPGGRLQLPDRRVS